MFSDAEWFVEISVQTIATTVFVCYMRSDLPATPLIVEAVSGHIGPLCLNYSIINSVPISSKLLSRILLSRYQLFTVD